MVHRTYPFLLIMVVSTTWAEISFFRRIMNQDKPDCPKNFFSHFDIGVTNSKGDIGWRNACFTTNLFNCDPYNISRNGCIDINETEGTLTLDVDQIEIIPWLEFINEFTIIFVGYIHTPLHPQNIILGPAGATGNCQITYKPGNILEIDSFTDYGHNVSRYGYIEDTTTISYQKQIKMPFDVTEMHTLEIYYKDGEFTVSQNYQIVEKFFAQFGAQFAQIGGFYGPNMELSIITIHDIIFATDADPGNMAKWLKDYLKKENVKITNTTYKGE